MTISCFTSLFLTDFITGLLSFNNIKTDSVQRHEQRREIRLEAEVQYSETIGPSSFEGALSYKLSILHTRVMMTLYLPAVCSGK